MAFCHRAYGILSQGLWHSITVDYLINRHKWRQDAKNRSQPKSYKYCKYCNGRRRPCYARGAPFLPETRKKSHARPYVRAAILKDFPQKKEKVEVGLAAYAA